MRRYAVEHPVVVVATAVVTLLVLVGALLLSRGGAPEAPHVAAEPELPSVGGVPAPLTGVLVDELPRRPALLVKVSNSPEARPQTGLEVADVVFEELTEGGVTRFIAVLHSQLPEVIGPVRSARPVDVQVVSGFGNPGFAFSGARPEVRTLVAGAAAVPITEGAPGFFRDDGRFASHPFAPHDLFLEVADGLAAVEARGARPLDGVGWVFADEPPPGGEDGARLEVVMSRWSTTSWVHDADAAVYRRAQDGAPSEVTGAGRIGAANVVVLDVRHLTGASGYPETDVLGAGEALVLRDGRRYPATWEKPTVTAPLRLLDAEGEAFPLARGPTWILLPDALPTVTSAAGGRPRRAAVTRSAARCGCGATPRPGAPR